MCEVSYNIVKAEVIKINGKDSQIFRNIGNDLKGKLSIIAYAAAIIFAFYFPLPSNTDSRTGSMFLNLLMCVHMMGMGTFAAAAMSAAAAAATTAAASAAAAAVF